MKKSTASFLRFLGIWLSLILATSTIDAGAWFSAIFAITLMVVVSLTSERYPLLTERNKKIIIPILLLLIVSLFQFQWKFNA